MGGTRMNGIIGINQKTDLSDSLRPNGVIVLTLYIQNISHFCKRSNLFGVSSWICSITDKVYTSKELECNKAA